MAQSLPPTDGGVPLPASDDANALSERGEAAAVSVGGHNTLVSTLSSLIFCSLGGLSASLSSSAEQEGASASLPPQLPPPVDDGADVTANNEGGDSLTCDFTNVKSVNEFYPTQEGKSKMQINSFTLNTLNKLETAEQKDHFCRRWRMCANNSEHANLMVELHEELAAQEEARASLAVDDDASIRSPPSLPKVPADFTNNDTKSLKETLKNHYPVQDGKSKKMIPIGTLKLLDTDAARHNFCLKWRKCNTVKEQQALKKKCEDAAAAKKKKEKEAKQRSLRAKRKAEKDEKDERKRQKEERAEANKKAQAAKKNEAKKRKREEARLKKAAEKENIVSTCSVVCYSNRYVCHTN